MDPPRDRDDLLGTAYLNIVPPSFRCPWEHDQPLAHPTRPGNGRALGDLLAQMQQVSDKARDLILATLPEHQKPAR